MCPHAARDDEYPRCYVLSPTQQSFANTFYKSLLIHIHYLNSQRGSQFKGDMAQITACRCVISAR